MIYVPNFLRTARRRYRRLRHRQRRELSLGTSDSLRILWESPAYPSLTVVDPSDPSHYVVRETRNISVFEGVFLWPDFSVISADQRTVEKSAGFSEERTEQLIAEGLLRNYPITFLEGTAISFGLGNKNHYHYLVDDISRLVTVRKVPYKHRRDPILVVTEDLPRSYLYLAQRILGDDTKVRVVPERSQIWCERFLAIPPLSRSCQALIEPKVAKLLSNGVPSFEMIHHTGKIYISRQKASKRRFLNEQELIQELQKLKVIPVVLEDLTLSQQKDIFRNAELVVANHGAGLTNLIFSERSPKVLEIHSGQGLEHYEWLCHSLQFPYNSMVVGSPGSNSDIEAPVEEILSWVTSASSSL